MVIRHGRCDLLRGFSRTLCVDVQTQPHRLSSGPSLLFSLQCDVTKVFHSTRTLSKVNALENSQNNLISSPHIPLKVFFHLYTCEK